MSQKRLVDLLRTAREFHEKLSDYYESSSAYADDEEVKILLDFMSRHEKALSGTIAEYEAKAPDAVLERWFRFPHEQQLANAFEHLDIRPDMTKDEAIEMAQRVDQALLQIYEQLRASAVSDSLEQTLDDLLDMEKREEVKKMRAALDMHD